MTLQEHVLRRREHARDDVPTIRSSITSSGDLTIVEGAKLHAREWNRVRRNSYRHFPRMKKLIAAAMLATPRNRENA